MHGLPPVVRLAHAQRALPGRRGPRDEKSCPSIELPRDPSSVGASLRALRAPRCPAWGRSPYMAALRPSEMDTIAPIWTHSRHIGGLASTWSTRALPGLRRLYVAAPTTEADQSITEVGRTTWRPMPSSFGSRPRAR